MVDRALKGKVKVKVNGELQEKELKTFAEQKDYIQEQLDKPEYLGKVKREINELSEKIKDANCQTLGQYFWHLYQKDRHNIDHKIRTKYTDREEHYLKEFDLICRTQELQDIDEKYSLKEPAKRYSGIVLDLYKAVFYQRPLKSQKHLVGPCTFEKNKARCPVSHPAFEEYRMWQFINNIKLRTPYDNNQRPLTDEEKEKVVKKFYREKSTFKFDDIARALTPKGVEAVYYKEREAKDADYVVNYKLNTNVSGCPVSAALKNVLGDKFNEVYKTQKHSAEKNGKPLEINITYRDIAWHALFTYDNQEKLREFGKEKLGLDDKKAKKFSKITPQQGYANLSLKAINKILPWLRKGLKYSHAVFMANLENVVDKDIWEQHSGDIETGIGNIIDRHDVELKKVNAVNNLVAKCRTKDEDGKTATWSEEAKPEYENELREQLQNVFSKKTWEEKENR